MSLPTAQAGWWNIPNLSQPNQGTGPPESPCTILTSDYEENWDVWLGWAVVEVDGADDYHGQRDDDGDGAGDGAADGPQEEDEDLQG